MKWFGFRTYLIVEESGIDDAVDDDQQPQLVTPFKVKIVLQVSDDAADEPGIVQGKEDEVDDALAYFGVFGHFLKRIVPGIGKTLHDAPFVNRFLLAVIVTLWQVSGVVDVDMSSLRTLIGLVLNTTFHHDDF